MKLESGLELLKQTIDSFWVIREKIYQLSYQLDVTYDTEMEFLLAKGKIARNMRPLIIKQGNPGDIRGNIIRFLRRIPSLEQLRQIPPMDLRKTDKDCHHIFIHLKKWYGEAISDLK